MPQTMLPLAPPKILTMGTLAALLDKHRELPKTLPGLLQLDHFGPKRARRLYEDLAITSLAELAEAIEAGKVEALPGFGKKTAENLRHASASFRAARPALLLADAEQMIQPLLE